MNSKQCRGSRRGVGLAAARSARAANRVLAGPTQKEMMVMCRDRGLVFDRDTKQCRPKKVRGSALENAYARGSLFFGKKNNFGMVRTASDQRPGQSFASATESGNDLNMYIPGQSLASMSVNQSINENTGGRTVGPVATGVRPLDALPFTTTGKKQDPGPLGLSTQQIANFQKSTIDGTSSSRIPVGSWGSDGGARTTTGGMVKFGGACSGRKY